MFDTKEYFDGNVISVAFQTKTLPATVGVMAVGNYEFNTGDKEKMTVVSGSMLIKLTDSDETQLYTAGESFDVGANSSFNVSITQETAYLCLYG